jgi:hypothetical protein
MGQIEAASRTGLPKLRGTTRLGIAACWCCLAHLNSVCACQAASISMFPVDVLERVPRMLAPERYIFILASTNGYETGLT